VQTCALPILARGRALPRPVDPRLPRALRHRRAVGRGRDRGRAHAPDEPGRRNRALGDALRPAFYALERGGWRDYVTLLHPPYTLDRKSVVALGAGLAPRLDGARLGWTFAA